MRIKNELNNFINTLEVYENFLLLSFMQLPVSCSIRDGLFRQFIHAFI